MKTCFLYSITCTKNKKVYVGVTSDCYTRFCHHRGDLRRGVHENRFLQAEYLKYGEDAFVYDVISEHPDRVSALRAEKYITECVVGLSESVCYNIVGGGSGLRSSVGFKTRRKEVSEETRTKMSISRTGTIQSEETRRKKSIAQSGSKGHNARKAIDESTGKIYGSLKEAAIDVGINYSTLQNRMNSRNNIKTTIKWLS